MPAVVLSLFDTGLSVVRDLHHYGIRTYGVALSLAEAGRRSRECTVIDSVSPQADSNALLQTLNQIYDRERRTMVLFAGVDDATSFISRHRKQLDGKFLFSLPSEEVCETFGNKARQLERVRSLGIRVPRTVQFSRVTGYQRGELGDFRFPAIIKPANAFAWNEHFSVKGFNVETRTRLDEILREVELHGFDVLVQELVPGPLENLVEVSGFVDQQGVVRGRLVTMKNRTYPRDIGVGASIYTTRNAIAESIVQKIVDGVPIRGFFNVELKKRAATAEYEYIETNIRPWQQVALGLPCGVPVVELAYRDATGQDLPEPRTAPEGKRWIDPIRDYYSMVQNPEARAGDLFTWLRELATADAITVFSLRDPMPGVQRLKFGRELLSVASQTAKLMARLAKNRV